jgi:ADP-ribose pyrophosphatase
MHQQQIEKWKELGRERVLDQYMKVDKVAYELPEGGHKDIFIKLQKPAACVVALTEANEVLMVEQYRPGPDKVLLELPGGYVEDDEDPEVGMTRELREETGYAGDMQFVTICLDDAYSTMIRSVFVATGCKKVAEQELDDSEFINVHLVSLEEFKKIIRSGEMTDVEVGFLGLDFLKLL